MEKLLETARDILIKNKYTCVLMSENEEYHSNLKGVKPLLDFLNSNKNFNGFYAADKIVGLGAAHLYVLLGVKSVWANVISEPAFALLKNNSIGVFYKTKAPFIINREGNDKCPIEKAVTGVENSKDALLVIKQTLENLRGK